MYSRANFDVSRLEQQRDAVIERLAKTDSECALIRSALVGRESDLRETKKHDSLYLDNFLSMRSYQSKIQLP